MNYHAPTPPPLFAVTTEDTKRLARQTREVLKRLQAGEKLTPTLALSFGCQRLAARVNELRDAGYAITTRRVGSVAEYSIESPNPEAK